MLNTLADFLVAKPSRAAAIVLSLIIILMVVVAGFAVQWALLGDEEDSDGDAEDIYPSEDVPLTLTNGYVQYVQEYTIIGWGNYSGSRFALCVNEDRSLPHNSSHPFGFGSYNDFGNQSLLGTGPNATMTRSIWSGFSGNESLEASIEITDLAGDGFLGTGDTVRIMIEPLWEDTVYTIGFFLTSDISQVMYLEWSFAVHHGEFFAWYSDYLPWEKPWYL